MSGSLRGHPKVVLGNLHERCSLRSLFGPVLQLLILHSQKVLSRLETPSVVHAFPTVRLVQ